MSDGPKSAAAPPAGSTRPAGGKAGGTAAAATSRDPMWTVGELLGWTQRRFEQAGVPTPRLDAQHLLADTLGCSRMSLYVRHDEVVAPELKATFREMVRRRLDREPVAYILGKRGFHAIDLELQVDPRVLPPRPETEHLVDLLLEELPPSADVLDVGTGSGAIALAIKRARPDARVIAVDVSAEAIEVARANALALDLEVEFHITDLLSGLAVPEGGWHAIAANLPYIPTADFDRLEPEVATHEPRLALDGGADGLDLIRRLVSSLCDRRPLREGSGAVYLEVGIGQAEAVVQLLGSAGFSGISTRADYGGVDRVVRAEN